MKNKWNEIYGGKVKTDNFQQLNEKQVTKILEYFPTAKSALDIGCGRGELLRQLKNKGLVVTGIDISSVAIEQAKKITNATLYLGNFENFSFPKKVKFDLIFVKFVLAYVEKKKEFFSHISELLNERGGLIIVSPVGKSDGEIFVKQKEVDNYMNYFSLIKEEILYQESDKKLSLFILSKQ